MVNRVLVTGARAPAALHIIRLLGVAGAQVFAADTTKRALASQSRFVQRYEILPSPAENPSAFSQTIKRICDQNNIELVIPTCEEIFWLAEGWQEFTPTHAQLFAPDFARLKKAHSKWSFNQWLCEMGLPAPRTTLITTKEQLANVPTETQVIKKVWSRFGKEVFIKPTAHDLKDLEPSRANPLITQDFIEGCEFCLYAVAHQGYLTSFSAYNPKYRAGLGAGIYFTPAHHPELQKFARNYIQNSNWHGQISFDVIMDENDQIWPIECNPRTISGVHFLQDPTHFLNALQGQTKPSSNPSKDIAVKSAMLYYAPKYLRQWRGYWRDYAHASNALHWQDDRLPWRTIPLTFAEYARIALRNRISLQAAATQDIEWNGEDAP